QHQPELSEPRARVTLAELAHAEEMPHPPLPRAIQQFHEPGRFGAPEVEADGGRLAQVGTPRREAPSRSRVALRNGFHHASLARYQSTVARSAPANGPRGCQPSPSRSLRASRA